MPADFASGPIVWRPSADYIDNARLTAFMRAHNIASFDELMQRSTADVAWFTDAVLKFLDIQFYKPYSSVVDLSKGIAWPQWCIDGQMNIVHNCLDKYQTPEAKDKPALIWEGEDGASRQLSFSELHAQVCQAANALRSLGIGKGDAVGIFMPMVPEIAVALLAIAKVGGIILPLFSGYGVDAVVSRLADGGAKALFTVDGFPRRGKPVEMKSTADAAAAQLPGLKHIIVLNHAKLPVPFQQGRDHWWHELVSTQAAQSPTEITSAEDPLMIIYTSGTTGRPKGAVHTHCGFPVKAAQDMAFGTDVRPGHLIYWMTDMGWMMGPWLVFGSLLLGATFFLYDGAPDFPQPDRTWAQVARHHITTLGVSPTLVRTLMPLGDELLKAHDLASVRYFASTGEPWNPDPWLWLFNVVGEGKRPIINYSGGTEISGGIVMGNPILPLKATAFAGPCPGIAADVYDEHGNSVTGQVGELVIKAPWIGMTRGFWQDPQRYEETYWSRWPGVWVHGDWAARDEDGQWYILGRSDDTIKIAGKRLGPAEVESVLVAHAAVVEAAAIAVPDDLKGSALVVFCVLAPQAAAGAANDALATELRSLLAAALGKPLAPKAVHFVPDLPKTRNAKVMRRMVRAAYLGLEAGDTSSLVNPDAVEHIRKVQR